MKKRLLSLLLALMLTASLAACGAPKQEEVPPPDSSVTDNADAEKPADNTQPAQPEVTLPEPDPETPAQEPQPAEKPAEKPAKKPVEKPAEQPAVSVDLTAFYDAMVKAGGEDMPAMIAAESEVLDTFYPGLKDIPTNQCLVNTAVISAAVGELSLVEVKNADDVQKVKDIFQARINYQVGTDGNPGAAWYPASVEGWKNNSKIVSSGNYVMLIVWEKKDTVVDAFNALFAK